MPYLSTQKLQQLHFGHFAQHGQRVATSHLWHSSVALSAKADYYLLLALHQSLKISMTIATDQHIEFKQLASLGDQKYPSFELNLIFQYLSQQGQQDWCKQTVQALDIADQLNEEFMPSHLALEGLNHVIKDQFSIGLGIRVAEHYTLDTFGALGVALRHAPSLYEALQITLGYYELIGSFTDLTLIQDQDSFTLRIMNVASLSDALEHLIFELTISGMCALGHEISPNTIQSRTLRFRMSLSDAQKQFFAERFHCTVEDNAKFNEWTQELAPLQKEIQYVPQDKSVLAQNIDELNELMESLKAEFALVDKFDRLARNNEDAFPDSRTLADALFMSERTFRRKLNKIGVNYNILMGKIRCQIAIAMLQQGEHTNEDIAFELGFSDAANFCNAFKKWTGHTPNYYRA